MNRIYTYIFRSSFVSNGTGNTDYSVFTSYISRYVWRTYQTGNRGSIDDTTSIIHFRQHIFNPQPYTFYVYGYQFIKNFLWIFGNGLYHSFNPCIVEKYIYLAKSIHRMFYIFLYISGFCNISRYITYVRTIQFRSNLA